MDPSIIRFHHFTSIESYCRLQEIFGLFDYQSRYDDKINQPYENFDIISYSTDEFCSYDNYIKLNFVDDFLLPGINMLEEEGFLNFRKEVYAKGLFTEDLLSNFAKHNMGKLQETYLIIDESQYLHKMIKLALLNILESIKNRVEEFIRNPYPLIKNKLEFNWNRTDIIVFFHLLRMNNTINWFEDADLGRIIDNMSKYKSDDNVPLYSDIKASRKHLNAFKNAAGRPDKEAIARLKNIFGNPDFYNH